MPTQFETGKTYQVAYAPLHKFTVVRRTDSSLWISKEGCMQRKKIKIAPNGSEYVSITDEKCLADAVEYFSHRAYNLRSVPLFCQHVA